MRTESECVFTIIFIVCGPIIIAYLGKTAENDGGTFRLKIPEGDLSIGDGFSLREFSALSVSPYRG